MSAPPHRRLVPEGTSPPQEHRTERYRFRPLTVEVLGWDWLALRTAIDRVREQEIPIPGFEGLDSAISVEEDFYDVAWHHREFELGSTLTYAVMAPDEERCLGSVYMYPAGSDAEVDTEIYMWLVEDEFQRAGDGDLYAAVQKWVAADFAFLGRVAYPGRDDSANTFAFENWALVPTEFEVPDRLAHALFTLVPLDGSHVVGDFDAWMGDVEHVRGYGIRLPGEPESSWPTYDLSPLTNLVDLGWHFKEFQRRSSFAYAIVAASNERRILGTVYIFPSEDEDVDASIPMWVRERDHREGLDAILFEAVRRWIEADWPFGQVDYPQGPVQTKDTG